MLAYVLSIVIAIGSFSFYMAAFFVPEIHRRQDFVWSGVGMFYALVLWFCAGRITGAVLLGQVASVALLGWLGWQTLKLRRELTPELVRTPVSWEDLQRWGQVARQGLQQYWQMGSLLVGVRAVWVDVSNAVAEMKNRVAGPKGEVRSRSPIPPLRRSPAYEFETETGQGESVPSEFATVSPRTQHQNLSRDFKRDTTGTVPPEPEQASLGQEPAADSTTPDSTTNISSRKVAEVASPQEFPKTEAKGSTESTKNSEVPRTEVPRVENKSTESTNESTQKTTESRRVGQISPNVAQKSVSQPNSVVALTSWIGERLRSFRQPKPKRAVIEIPPRPPSIPRPSSPTKADRRPSAGINEVKDSTVSETNWVEVGDEADTNWPEEGDETNDFQNWPTEADPAPRPAEPDTNWPDVNAE